MLIQVKWPWRSTSPVDSVWTCPASTSLHIFHRQCLWTMACQRSEGTPKECLSTVTRSLNRTTSTLLWGLWDSREIGVHSFTYIQYIFPSHCHWVQWRYVSLPEGTPSHFLNDIWGRRHISRVAFGISHSYVKLLWKIAMFIDMLNYQRVMVIHIRTLY